MAKRVVVDADALIALTLEKDPHHQKALNISKHLAKEGVEVFFPVSVFPEAVTTLRRVFNQDQKAHLLVKQVQEGAFPIIFIDEAIFTNACSKFNQTKSKQNTFFDCLVVAVAEELGASEIFSFDKWYQKLGFKLSSPN